MSEHLYKILHILSVIIIFTSIGGMIAIVSSKEGSPGLKKLFSALHGVGLLIALIAGFGLMAKLGLNMADNGWITLKIVIWLTVGALLSLIKKKPAMAQTFLWFSLFLGFAATFLAITKPF